MRISTNQIAENSLINITNSSERYFAAQERLSSGKQLTKPSDDPAGIDQALDLTASLDSLGQYQRNINDAKAFLGTTDSSLATVGNLLRQARTYAVQGATNVLDNTAQQGIAQQISAIIKQMGEIGNTMYGNRYIFGGQQTLQKPFLASGTTYTYQGGTTANANDKIQVEINVNETVQVNVAGDAAFSQAFSTLTSLHDRLAAGDVAQISQTDIQAVDDVLTNINSIRADVGARVHRLDDRSTQIDQSKAQFSEFVSKIVDVDVPKTVVELSAAQNAYQAALAATSRGFQQSLLDFIR